MQKESLIKLLEVYKEYLKKDQILDVISIIRKDFPDTVTKEFVISYPNIHKRIKVNICQLLNFIWF